MLVKCIISILLLNGSRVVEQLEGIEIREGYIKNPPTHILYIDFEKELKRRKYKLDKAYTYVQKVNENSCLYLEDPSL